MVPRHLLPVSPTSAPVKLAARSTPNRNEEVHFARRTTLRSLSVLVTLLTMAGCAGAEGDGAEGADGALIGGREDTAHPAVGALASRVRMMNGEVIEAFCTGTLISPRHVLTAEHCFPQDRGNVAFVLGPRGSTVLVTERRDPERVVNVVRVEAERTVTGGGLELGSDVAIAELEEPITDIEPVRLGYLSTADVGKQFTAVGYGIHDVAARGDAVKRTGNVELRTLAGKYLHVLFPRLEDYASRSGLSLDEARLDYDGLELLPRYEVLAGGKSGNAQGCGGDSGGPLLRNVNRKATVFGVASFVLSTQASPCDGGIVYATFGEKTREFIERKLARCSAA